MPRTLATLVIVLTLASAGCLGFGDDEDSPPTTTTPVVSPTPTETTPTTTPTSTPPASPTPTTTPTSTPTPTPQPPAPPPKEVLNVTYDFAQGDATGQSPHVETFTVDAGYGNLTINMSIVARDVIGNPIGLGTGAEIAIVDPNGEEVTTQDASASATVEATVEAIPGAWTVEFRGVASTEAAVRIMEVA